MLSAVAKAAQVFADEGLVEMAIETAEFILRELIIDDDLMHSFKDGSALILAFQDDYAAVAAGFLDLYEATQDPAWLEASRGRVERMLALFWDVDEGGFFFTPPGHDDLIVRSKSPFDGATPAGNALAASVLLRLSTIGDDPELRQRAEQVLLLYRGLMQRAPTSCSAMLNALDYFLDSPYEVALIGNARQRREMQAVAARRFVPNKVIVGADPGLRVDASGLPPLLEGKTSPEGPLPRAYVCRDSVCSAAVTGPVELADLLPSQP